MIKQILTAGAMTLAMPAVAQVNANTAADAHPGTVAPDRSAPAAQNTPRRQSAAPGTAEDTIGGTEGTTASHAITSSTDGAPNVPGPNVSGAARSQGAAGGASAGASGAFTGVGGPSGDLIDVAQEMLGDQERVSRVMNGRDRNMKASDLLNAAMLTLIQSGTNTPR